MPEQVTFDVEHNLDDPSLPPWTIRIYPIDPDDAATPARWNATISQHGVTIQTAHVTDHTTWPGILNGTEAQGDDNESR